MDKYYQRHFEQTGSLGTIAKTTSPTLDGKCELQNHQPPRAKALDTNGQRWAGFTCRARKRRQMCVVDIAHMYDPSLWQFTNMQTRRPMPVGHLDAHETMSTEFGESGLYTLWQPHPCQPVCAPNCENFTEGGGWSNNWCCYRPVKKSLSRINHSLKTSTLPIASVGLDNGGH